MEDLPHNHADGIASIDLFVIPTIAFEQLFAFLVLGHRRRQLLWFAVTHESSFWKRQVQVECQFSIGLGASVAGGAHLIVFGEAHLRRVLQTYARYYNDIRTHRSLEKDAPLSHPVQRTGIVTSRPILGGLHHHYVRI
jgi:hypothetical protein